MHSYVSFCPTPQTTPTFQKIGSSMAHIMAPVFVRGQEKIRQKTRFFMEASRGSSAKFVTMMAMQDIE